MERISIKGKPPEYVMGTLAQISDEQMYFEINSTLKNEICAILMKVGMKSSADKLAALADVTDKQSANSAYLLLDKDVMFAAADAQDDNLDQSLTWIVEALILMTEDEEYDDRILQAYDAVESAREWATGKV